MKNSHFVPKRRTAMEYTASLVLFLFIALPFGSRASFFGAVPVPSVPSQVSPAQKSAPAGGFFGESMPIVGQGGSNPVSPLLPNFPKKPDAADLFVPGERCFYGCNPIPSPRPLCPPYMLGVERGGFFTQASRPCMAEREPAVQPTNNMALPVPTQSIRASFF